MNPVQSHGLLGLAAFLLTLSITPLFRRIAIRLDFVDRPGERKAQKEAVAYLGGGAVFTTLLLSFAGAYLGLGTDAGLEAVRRLFPLELLAPRPMEETGGTLLALSAGLLVIFTVGLVDDWRGAEFPVWQKLAGQFVAAGIVVASGVRIEVFGSSGLDQIITLFWIVGITNAFNLLDNMDGLSSGVAVISTLCFWIVAVSQSQWLVGAVLAVFGGAVAGFLPWNWHQAKIYLGDAGSLVIGFFLGSMTVIESYVYGGDSVSLEVLLPLLVLAIPLFDTLSVIVIRIRAGRPIYQGDRNHLSHRLVRLGMTVPEAVLFLYLLQIVTGLGAVLIPKLPFEYGWIVLAQNVIVVVIVSLLMFFGGGERPDRSA